MSSPLVTVTMPVYNPDERFLRATQSIKNQTYKNWELVIVDDGSETNTLDQALSELDQDNIHVIRLKQNQGRGAARQAALNKAQGKYLTMVDSDDWIASGKLSHQVEFLESHPEVDLHSTAMWMVSDNQELLGVENYNYPQLTLLHPLASPGSIPLAHAPSMIRTETARRHGYNPVYRSAEDFDFLLKILLNSHSAVDPTPFYAYECESNKSLLRSREQLTANEKIISAYLSEYPQQVRSFLWKARLKKLGYMALNILPGFKQLFLKKRYHGLNSAVVDHFLKEYNNLESTLPHPMKERTS